MFKQDKGRGMVIIDVSEYINKYLNMLNNGNFVKLTDDPTKLIKNKIQRAIRKIKSKLSKGECNKIYLTGLTLSKPYGTVKKKQKMTVSFLCDLLFHTTYCLSFNKTSRKVLSLFSQSEFTVKNKKLIYKNLETCCHQMIIN